MTIDLHCAGCGAITSIPPLCGPCFADSGAIRPIQPSTRAGFDWMVPLPGCRQHVTRHGLVDLVETNREMRILFESAP